MAYENIHRLESDMLMIYDRGFLTTRWLLYISGKSGKSNLSYGVMNSNSLSKIYRERCNDEVVYMKPLFLLFRDSLNVAIK